jgi:hypothetical protein
MKMENRTENKELMKQVDNLELVDRMLNLINKFEIAIITVGLIAMLAIMI